MESRKAKVYCSLLLFSHQFSKMVNHLLKRACGTTTTRSLWTYVAHAFNTVDSHRLTAVGAERLCAEWVLKNSGKVKLADRIIYSDYNQLPAENRKVGVLEIDGTGATIMSIGLEHLKNCSSIEKIILNNCKYLDDEGLEKLAYVNGTMQELHVIKCKNISANGLLQLQTLSNLKRLQLGYLPFVKQLEDVICNLQQLLPKCDIKRVE